MTKTTINGRFILTPKGSAWLYARIEEGKVAATTEEAVLETHVAANDGFAWLANVDRMQKEEVIGEEAAAIVHGVMGGEANADQVVVERIIRRWEARGDDSTTETIEVGTVREAKEQVKEIWQAGDYNSKCVVEVGLTEIDADGEAIGYHYWVSVECGEDEPAPECVEGEDHEWESPLECVGGIDSNPGVWSLGGTTITFKECCCKCGKYKIETQYGSQRNPGQVDEVEYEDADEASLEWIAQRLTRRNP